MLVIRDHLGRIATAIRNDGDNYRVSFPGHWRTFRALDVEHAETMAKVTGSVGATMDYRFPDPNTNWSVEWTRAPEIANLRTSAELREWAAAQGLRTDWHEPDEQGVTVEVVGRSFDNAMCQPMPDNEIEVGVYLLKDGVRVAYTNLALLFALAARDLTGL
jgi:hypothetical protein